MKTGYTIVFGALCWLKMGAGFAQNVAGFWLGVTYPANPNQAVYNYTMTITQTGTAIGGTAQTANPNVPFGGVAYLSGQVVAPSTVRFSEADKNGRTDQVKNVCFWTGELTYDPVNESLTGTYRNIVNNVTCTDPVGGRVELYRIVLKSGNTYCKGAPINLVITGKNIRWYDSATKTRLLARGNTYSPSLTRTTTFYITQTLYQMESPAVPITIEVTEPTLKATVTNASCGQTNGQITLTPPDQTAGWQYSLNNSTAQAAPGFNNLPPGSYTVVAKAPSGCQTQQSVTIANEAVPTLTSLSVTPPRCQSANGQLTVSATGGTGPLAYSLDGTTYQSQPQFGNLPGGTYTIYVRDEKKCAAAPRTVNVPPARLMTVLSADAVATTCGQANGQATLVMTGGTAPIQYSMNGKTWQPTATFTQLKDGTYTLTARDSLGCTISQSVRVAGSAGPPSATVQVTPEACDQQNGTIRLTFGNGPRPTRVLIDNTSVGPADSLTGMRAGTYTLVMTDDRNCQTSQLVAIAADCANLIHLPDAFSPNADNRNDVLSAYFRFPSLLVNRFIVYDRWGAVLYNRTNFALTNGEPIWNGQINGQYVPAGTYGYLLDCRFPDGSQTTYRRSVVLMN